MHFHHLHFYVKDAAFWQDWFTAKLAFQAVNNQPIGSQLRPHSAADRSAADRAATGQTAIASTAINSAAIASTADRSVGETASYRTLKQGDIEVRLSDPTSSPEAEQYLQQHPPGIADLALATNTFEAVLAQAVAQGAKLTRNVSGIVGQRQCQLQGWGSLRHTLIEVADRSSDQTLRSMHSAIATQQARTAPQTPSLLSSIDHAVLNVAKGQMEVAARWYQRVFGLAQGQRFEITTARSGLCSQVLVHPHGSLQLPINEPSSTNSQIQEFINHNRGAGIQHVALKTLDAVGAIARLRQRGLDLISVPATYYEDLRHRPHCPLLDTSAASAQQLLLDWAASGKQGALLQTFTKPIFPEPTFFFEIIERGTYAENGQIKSAQGFGEGNFQALFEAIERAQLERGSLV